MTNPMNQQPTEQVLTLLECIYEVLNYYADVQIESA